MLSWALADKFKRLKDVATGKLFEIFLGARYRFARLLDLEIISLPAGTDLPVNLKPIVRLNENSCLSFTMTDDLSSFGCVSESLLNSLNNARFPLALFTCDNVDFPKVQFEF